MKNLTKRELASDRWNDRLVELGLMTASEEVDGYDATTRKFLEWNVAQNDEELTNAALALRLIEQEAGAQYPTRVVWMCQLGTSVMNDQTLVTAGEREGELVVLEGLGPRQSKAELRETTAGEENVVDDSWLQNDDKVWVYDDQNADGEGLMIVLA